MIGNLYTIAELADLINAKDVEVLALTGAVKNLPASVTLDDAFASDFASLGTRYAAARALGEAAIGVADIQPIPDDANPEGDPPYRAIISALLNGGAEGVTPPGSLQDLWNRVEAAQGAPILEPPVPQPTPGSDLDLKWYNESGKILASVKQASTPIKMALLGAGAALGTVAIIKVVK